MYSNMTVSIIMPVYNTQNYVSDAVKSILKQSYKNIELLLINDGSSDNSLSICRNFEKIDSRVRLISTDNHGVSSARNIGIENSSGEYLQFVDSDDILIQDAVMNLVNEMRENMSDIVIGGFEEHFFVGNDIVKNEKFQGLNIKCSQEEFSKKYIGLKRMKMINSLWNKLYRKDVIRKNRIYFEKSMTLGEDLLFNIEYFKKIKRFSFIEKPVYIYCRRNELSLSDKYYDNKFYIMKKLIDKELEFLKSYDLSIGDYCEKYWINESVFHFETVQNTVKNKKERKERLIQETQVWKIKNYNFKKMNLYQKIYFYFLRNRLIFFCNILFKIKRFLKGKYLKG